MVDVDRKNGTKGRRLGYYSAIVEILESKSIDITS